MDDLLKQITADLLRDAEQRTMMMIYGNAWVETTGREATEAEFNKYVNDGQAASGEAILDNVLKLADYFKKQTITVKGKVIEVTGYRITETDEHICLSRKRLPDEPLLLDTKEGDWIIIEKATGMAIVAQEQKKRNRTYFLPAPAGI